MKKVIGSKKVLTIGIGSATYPLFEGVKAEAGTKREIKNGYTVITTITLKGDK
jgi:hypothetical protein